MLTPAQVKNHRFELSGRGHYRADEVDEFFDEVYDSYSQMFKENGDLVRKIGLLADKVEEYRNDEDNIRAALLTAQRMADKIVKEARESVEEQTEKASDTAQKMVDEAREKANAILEEAKFAAQESMEKSGKKAEELLFQARRDAEQEAEKIVSGAKEKLESMNREIALRSAEMEKLNRSVSEFKAHAASVCGEFDNLLKNLTVRAEEDLAQRIDEYIRSQASPIRPESPKAVKEEIPAPAVVPSPETTAPTASASVEEKKREEPVRVEIDPSVLDSDFNIGHMEEEKPSDSSKSGFKLNLQDLDKTADYRELIPEDPKPEGEQLKFGDHYDIFEDDEEEEEERPSKPFLNFFKK